MFAVANSAAALLAGNAVVLKAPEQASLSALALAEVGREIFPPGVFNVITGYGHDVGAAIVRHPAIPRIGFTGSVPTGRRILEGAAAHIKHVTLELGGKNPLIIAEGSDPEFAATVAVRGMNFTHAGQSCQSTSRVLIFDELYEEVTSRMVEKMAALVIGDPQNRSTDVGPVAFKAHYDRILGYIETGVGEGATLAIGGRRPGHLPDGLYIEPTLFVDVTEDMRIAREEIFGPVVVAMRYQQVDEAIRIANDTEFGLTSRVLAGTLDAASAIGREIRAGTTLLNTSGARPQGMPFGGFKESGLGKQGSLEEVLSYTEEKSVVAAI
jgi:betaine-aldehyde dehydrogenase